MISFFAKNSGYFEKMLGDMKNSSPLYRPSRFWINLNEDHLKRISSSGLENFKRSVNLRYFSWGILAILAHGMFPVLHALFKGNWKPFVSGGFGNYNNNLGEGAKRFNFLTAYIYKTYISCLFDFVKISDKHKLLNKLEEPSVGNPFTVIYKRRSVSQDLCNSVHEFNTIANNIDTKKVRNVVELGVGYGRTAYVFLKSLPRISYTIIDIPPALYIAQWYLSKLFGKTKVFHYRRFRTFNQVKKEFDNARIRFLMADQIELLPKKYFDLTLNISSLHEMRRNQIANYLKQINRVTRGFFYTKQWHRAMTSDNSHIKQDEYPTPTTWEEVFSRYPHPIQRWFFDTLYKIN